MRPTISSRFVMIASAIIDDRNYGHACNAGSTCADLPGRPILAEGARKVEAWRCLQHRIDAQDRVWVLHRPRTLTSRRSCNGRAPGDCVRWGRQFYHGLGWEWSDYEWPQREHGIHIDYKGFVWIGGNNCPGRKLPGLEPVADDQLLKFTQAGKFVMQIGHSSQSGGNADTKNLQQPADAFVYRKRTKFSLLTGMATIALLCLMRIRVSSNACGARLGTSLRISTIARHRALMPCRMDRVLNNSASCMLFAFQRRDRLCSRSGKQAGAGVYDRG